MMKNVISPQVASGMLEHMNANSVLAFLSQIVTDAEARDVELDNSLRNDIANWQAALNERLAQTDQSIARAESLAKLIEGTELTQIEKILRDLIDSEAMQGLFENMAVAVGDKQYKVTSLVSLLTSMPKEVKGELTYSADGQDITGYMMTLDDGVVVSFTANVIDDEDAGTTEAVFETDDFKGVAAVFSQEYLRKVTTINSFGNARQLVSRRIKSISHVVIALSAEEYTAAADPVPDVDADGDNDGVANNPLA